ncbi:tail fiber domain-containing protein [Burkholderia sp. SR8]|uniref:tail fiber domain-containing protein n=1 Tax=Burkholderia sp. SR8 TaxID=3062277 RepID=UPI004063C3CD
MSIIGNLPTTLQNGTTADATQVMGDLNYITNQVNANAQPLLPAAPSFTGLTLNEPANGTTTFLINAPNDSNGANIQLLGNGSTTPSKFIRVINGVLQFLNSVYSSVLMSLDDSGNLTVSGNLTASGTVSGSDIRGTSDERLKKDWKPLAEDFLESIAQVRHGTYTRIDTGERRVGVGAQSLQRILPEAVFGDETLCVAEGSAALAIVVELTREVIRLRALVEPKK